jgi:hypothetical protein
MTHTPNSGDLNPESQDPGKRPPVEPHPSVRKRGDDKPNDPEITPPNVDNDDEAS